jgi:hypothetical protein
MRVRGCVYVCTIAARSGSSGAAQARSHSVKISYKSCIQRLPVASVLYQRLSRPSMLSLLLLLLLLLPRALLFV